MTATALRRLPLFTALFAGLAPVARADDEFAGDRAPVPRAVSSFRPLPGAKGPIIQAAATAPDTGTVSAAEIRKAVDEALKERDEKAKQAAQTTRSWDVGADRRMTGTWSDGLIFESADRAFRMAVGGTTQFDMGWYNANQSVVNSVGQFNNLVDPGQSLQDGMDFRRARVRMNGMVYEQLEFFAQFDFANSVDLRQRTLGIPNPAGVPGTVQGNFDPSEGPLFNEVYVGLVKLPVIGNLRVGRQRESFNFVTATQDRNLIWMERGLMFDAFNGNYNFSQGVTVSRTYFNGRAYSMFGLFMQNNSTGRLYSSVGDGAYAYDGRITCLPVYDEDDRVWVHLGADVSYRNLYQNQVRYRARPDVRVGTSFQVPNLVDSGTIFSRDAQQIANLEYASAWGRWTFAAEGTVSRVPNAYTGGLPRATGTLPRGVVSRGDYETAGGYVELLCFLTPDHRGYNKDRPGYARVNPSRRFFFLEGDDGAWAYDCGAWEVGVRYDYVDLTNGGIDGGMAQGVTGALNWYLMSNARVMLNYSWMQRDFGTPDRAGRVGGEVRALGVRFHCDF